MDRHPLMRQAAAEWINRSSGLKVCGTAGGMASALRAITQLHPDLVVSEILRPRDLGFIRELHRRHSHLPILVFTILDAALYATRAWEAGACRFVTKEAGGHELIRNIRAVLRGRRERNGHSITQRARRGKEVRPVGAVRGKT